MHPQPSPHPEPGNRSPAFRPAPGIYTRGAGQGIQPSPADRCPPAAKGMYGVHPSPTVRRSNRRELWYVNCCQGGKIRMLWKISQP
ncbi:hypothetical protein CE91St17_12830 [Alistipes onderdonkii]|nr:hypothetical protein CE91St18_17400 [Alistipes onderdonkii]GKG96221.1 hypothetical protein CE91St17_12830 [Alistipes onderdonkii]